MAQSLSFTTFEQLTEERDRLEIENIFFETSPVKEFKTAEDKEKFLYKYLGHYQRHHGTHFWIARLGNQVIGYCAGAVETLRGEDLFTLLPHIELFRDMYERYPSHLHINCSSKHRGLGVGSLLLRYLEEDLVRCKSKGVHLITTATARNVSFYLKNGYSHRIERLHNDTPLLFLGKKL